jgi:hypothetical protein
MMKRIKQIGKYGILKGKSGGHIIGMPYDIV